MNLKVELSGSSLQSCSLGRKGIFRKGKKGFLFLKKEKELQETEGPGASSIIQLSAVVVQFLYSKYPTQDPSGLPWGWL